MRRVALAILSCAASLAAASCVSAATPSGTDAACQSRATDVTTVATDAGALVTVPLSACDPNVYMAPITIGGSSFALLFDTGSTSLEIAAAPCASCVDAGVSELYDPSKAVDRGEPATASFGPTPPSYYSGEIYADTVGFGASPATTKLNLVAIHDESGFFTSSCPCGARPQGIIGFGPGLNAVSGTGGFFDALVAGGVVSDAFAIRLCEGSGTLWLGGYDPAFTNAPPLYVPLNRGGLYYTTHLDAIAAAGVSAPIPTGSFTETMLDSGSSLSSLPPAAFTTLTDAIASTAAFTQVFGLYAPTYFAHPELCTSESFSKAELDAMLPPLTLTFGPITVEAVATESYLVESEGAWCPAVTSQAPSEAYEGIAALLGTPMLSSNVVIFDRANARVGFAPHTPCP